MAHINLSIPDDVYNEMKNHPEIKWSEIARKSIIEKTIFLKNKISSKNLLNLLPEETKKSIYNSSEEDSIKFYKKIKEKEWKRKRYMTQA